ncbi:serine hydrolase domain-containing protein [Kordiimonas laminariae]|uniref:serine hydrolase domain-containing protein n=1 Tax=Kordiimonas laminariae TaxID=2917717 RepID=UPI00248C79B8|nr:serine hydrolase domain-containing protein [Kordiimonas laminariae]
MTQPHAAGALVSTPEDLLRWNIALHNGKLLKDATYRQMITPQGKAVEAEYGFGINNQQFRGEVMLSHGGGIHGFNSFLMYLPESEVGVAIIQNSDSSLSDFRPSEIAFRIAAYALGNPFPEPVVEDLSKSELREYEGVYQINEHENREIRLMGDQLTSKRTGGVPLPLMPIGGDQFLFDNGMDVLKFTRDDGAEISGMELKTIKDSEGTFSALVTTTLPKNISAASLSSAQKERVTGTYQGGPGLILHVRIEGRKILVQLEGQAELEATAQTADLYFLPQTGASLEFAKGDQAPNVTLSQGGRSVTLERAPN